jgi:hypothetical protein
MFTYVEIQYKAEYAELIMVAVLAEGASGLK